MVSRTLGKVTTNTELVRFSWALWLDVNNQGGRVERATKDALDDVPRKGAGHAAGRDLLAEVVED